MRPFTISPARRAELRCSLDSRIPVVMFFVTALTWATVAPIALALAYGIAAAGFYWLGGRSITDHIEEMDQ